MQLLAICRGFGGCFWSQTGLVVETSQERGEGPTHPGWVWSSPPPSWGHPAGAFLHPFFWLRDLGPDWRSHSWDLSLSFSVPLLRGAPAHAKLCFCSESCRLDSPFLISPCCSKGPVDAGGSWAGGGAVQEQKHGKRAASPAEALLCLPSCLPRCFRLRVSKS